MTSPIERASAPSELEPVSHWPQETRRGPAHRKLLFVYGVCGLGGIETSIANKIEALGAVGVEARALFPRFWGDGGHLMAKHPAFVVESDEDAQIRFVQEWSPDAVVVIDTPKFVRVFSNAGVRCSLLFETHMSDFVAFKCRRVLEAMLHPDISMVIVPSQFNRTNLMRHAYPERRIRVIRNPIDWFRSVDARQHPLTRQCCPCERPIVLFVGRLEPQKNALEFIQICRELSNCGKDVQGVVLGDAVDTTDYAARVCAEASAIGKNVTFIPRVAYEDMPSVYEAVASSGGCLLSTSVHESQPMILLEAMATGCPAVASDVGGVGELISHNITGHLYELGDIQGAAEAVTKLIDEHDHRTAIVTAAQEYVRSNHTGRSVAEAYVAILDELVTSSDTSPAH